MPELEKVSEDFKNDPVIILGINNDPDEADARFVADKMHLNYATNLRGTEIPGTYGVHAFPTFILIDSTGIVRDVPTATRRDCAKNWTRPRGIFSRQKAIRSSVSRTVVPD